MTPAPGTIDLWTCVIAGLLRHSWPAVANRGSATFTRTLRRVKAGNRPGTHAVVIPSMLVVMLRRPREWLSDAPQFRQTRARRSRSRSDPATARSMPCRQGVLHKMPSRLVIDSTDIPARSVQQVARRSFMQ